MPFFSGSTLGGLNSAQQAYLAVQQAAQAMLAQQMQMYQPTNTCFNPYATNTTTTGGELYYYPTATGSCGLTATTSNSWAYVQWVPTPAPVESRERARAPRYDADAITRRMQAVADQRAELRAHTERQEAERRGREADERARILAEQDRVRAEQRRQYEEAEARRRQANDTARELLLSNLTPEQRATFEGNGWFVVEGGRSRKQYRIHAGNTFAGNIEGLDGRGRPVERFCSHLPCDLPPHDHHLAQKLFIEADEDEFLRRANRTPLAA